MRVFQQLQDCLFLGACGLGIVYAGGHFVVVVQAPVVQVDRTDPTPAVVADQGLAVVERFGKYGYVDRYGNDTFK